MRAPRPEDRWHADHPLVNELDPLRALAEMTSPDPIFSLHAIRTDGGIAVSRIGFFGPPDAHGCVEVGYGIVEGVREQGLATEALKAAVRLAEVNGARQIKADRSG